MTCFFSYRYFEGIGKTPKCGRAFNRELKPCKDHRVVSFFADRSDPCVRKIVELRSSEYGIVRDAIADLVRRGAAKIKVSSVHGSEIKPLDSIVNLESALSTC